MTRSWLLAALVACHTAPPPAPPVDLLPPPASDPPPVATPPQPTDLTIEAACGRFVSLSDAGCDWTQRFPPAFKSADVCARSLATWVAPETPEHGKLQRTVNCWARDCDDAAACMIDAQASAPPPGPRTCGEDGTGPIVVDAAMWARRRGVDAKRFSDVPTSEQTPIELCGVDGEVEWMARVSCDNGSHPYPTQDAANRSRDAWIGEGGRCNSILDRYSVACPEATYTVYVDRYVCPQP